MPHSHWRAAVSATTPAFLLLMPATLGTLSTRQTLRSVPAGRPPGAGARRRPPRPGPAPALPLRPPPSPCRRPPPSTPRGRPRGACTWGGANQWSPPRVDAAARAWRRAPPLPVSGRARLAGVPLLACGGPGVAGQQALLQEAAAGREGGEARRPHAAAGEGRAASLRHTLVPLLDHSPLLHNNTSRQHIYTLSIMVCICPQPVCTTV